MYVVDSQVWVTKAQVRVWVEVTRVQFQVTKNKDTSPTQFHCQTRVLYDCTIGSYTANTNTLNTEEMYNNFPNRWKMTEFLCLLPSYYEHESSGFQLGVLFTKIRTRVHCQAWVLHTSLLKSPESLKKMCIILSEIFFYFLLDILHNYNT